ncbi:MAG: YceD family protein [Sideroxydans sp.]
MLLDSAGTLAYVVQGGRTNDHNVLQVSLNGVVHLRCQRCLGDLEYPVEVSSRLKLASAEELDAVDDEDEDEYIEATSQLDVVGLVEDELLLSLPYAPRHADGVCSSVNEGLKQSANPFAVLAGLKK